MGLLVLDQVTKRPKERRSAVTVLNQVNLTVAPGEIVAVRGSRQSARTTLLAVAAGAEHPDSGTVLFEGRNLARHKALGHGIGLVAPIFPADTAITMAELVGMPLLFKGVAGRQARERGAAALDAIGIGDVAGLLPTRCKNDELLLAAFAQAAMTQPRLLICDVPIIDFATRVTDRIVNLLRSFALLDEMAVLVATDGTVSGANHTLDFHDGKLHADGAVPRQGSASLDREENH